MLRGGGNRELRGSSGPSPARWGPCRGGGGPPRPQDPASAGQERSNGRRGGGEGGACRNGERVPQGRGQPGGDDPITACSPPIGDEGEDPGDQPAPGAGAHLPGGTPCIAPRSVPPRLGAGGRPVPARAASESHGCGQARPSPSRSTARCPQRGDREA